MSYLYRFCFWRRFRSIRYLSESLFTITNRRQFSSSVIIEHNDERSKIQQRAPPQRRPSWLERSAPSPSSGFRPPPDQQEENPEVERFMVSPAASDPEKFQEFLSILRRRKPLPEWAVTGGSDEPTVGESGGERQQFKSILYTAPYLALHHGLAEDFADVAEEWFYRARPLFVHDTRRGEMTVSLQFSPNVDQHTRWKRVMTPVFTLAHQLQYLGRVNQATHGRLVDNLGWRNVSFLARRMMECGFFTYTFNNVCNAALSGLRDLYTSGWMGGRNDASRHQYYGGLKQWLLAMAHYLAAAESKPAEWRHLIGELSYNASSIPSILGRIRVLHAMMLLQDKTIQPEMAAIMKYLTKALCNYARIHFDDDIVEDCRSAMERRRISAHLNVGRSTRFLNEFAGTWQKFQPELNDTKFDHFKDPDYYIQGTWRSWFQAANVVASQLLLTDEFVKETKSTAATTTKDSGETNVLNERSLQTNMGMLRSPQTWRLLCNAPDIAALFNESSSFYVCFYETWKKLLDLMIANAPGSAKRDLSFMVSNLIKIAIADAYTPEPEEDPIDEEAGDEEGSEGEEDYYEQEREQRQPTLGKKGPASPSSLAEIIQDETKLQLISKEQPQSQIDKRKLEEPIWREEHEETITFALKLLKDLDADHVPYRAMVEIVQQLAELKREKKLENVPSNEFLQLLRHWLINKRAANLVYNSSSTATSIKEAIKKMELKESKILNEILMEIDKLYALGQK